MDVVYTLPGILVHQCLTRLRLVEVDTIIQSC